MEEVKPTVGSLFAGIGGFDLGFERAGFETVWQVEIDEYCRRVLERHFPRAERFGDIRECGAHNLKPVDVVAGGFPCQDISTAGKRIGIDGSRSGLWEEMRRVVCELRPAFVVVENVSALLVRGIERVLGDLAASGYDAEWDCIPACAFGAPHRRDRIWIVAYPASADARSGAEQFQSTELTHREPSQFLSHADCRSGAARAGNNNAAVDVANAERAERWPGKSGGDVTDRKDAKWLEETGGIGTSGANDRAGDVADSISEFTRRNGIRWSSGLGWWEREPAEALLDARERGRQEDGLPVAESLLGRVANGIPNRVDRLTGLGNALVPQIAQWIAERIKESMKA